MFFIIICVIFLCLSPIQFKQYELADITYGDCVYKEFTVSGIDERRGKNPFYFISVKEDDKPVKTSYLLYGRLEDNGIENLKENDVIFTYVTESEADDYSYEALEIKTVNEDILLLSDYVEKAMLNAKIVIVLCIGLTVVLLAVGIVILIRERKDDVLIKLLRGKDLSRKERDKILGCLKDDEPALSEDELLAEARKCYYKEDGVYYTKINESEYDLYMPLLKVLYPEMSNGEFRVMFDTADDESAFIFYKDNDYIFGENCSIEDDSGKFMVYLILCDFEYPKRRKLTRDQKKEFAEKIEKYNSEVKNIFVIEKN